MVVPWYAVAFLAASAFGASIAPEKQVLENSECGRVWVTVHSPDIRIDVRTKLLDAIELNWDFNGCATIPKQAMLLKEEYEAISSKYEWHVMLNVTFEHQSVALTQLLNRAAEIGLFESRPSSWDSALTVYPIVGIQGYVVTNVSLGEDTLPGGWEKGTGLKGPHCLWPWTGAGDDDIQAFNCLKIQPTWMEENAHIINKLRVGELAIAGTHNAGAWKFNTEINKVTRDSFVLCQDRSIWSQLVHGIRYLDFRIAYYDFYPNEEDRYWLNHNLIRVRPLVPLLKEIKSFLDSTKEVIFFDAHHFPIGFYNPDGSPIRSVHAGLLELVQRELGPHIASAADFLSASQPRGPTMQTLIDADKRLLFSYVDNAIVGENNWLWPILPHLWANTNNPHDLFRYLDQAIFLSPTPSARSPMFSAMAQTTPTVLDIIFARGSLRENADEVNRIVTQRFATKWRQHANIISTDFFLGDDVIDVSIAISVERGSRL